MPEDGASFKKFAPDKCELRFLHRLARKSNAHPRAFCRGMLHRSAAIGTPAAVRVLVIILAVLAAIKIWMQQDLQREAAEEALLAAYREHALAACRDLPQTDARGMPLAVSAFDWRKADRGEIRFGNAQIRVPFWQIDNANWNARYRNPVVRLHVGNSHTKLACDYDILTASAYVTAAS
jgi:hypothetical protein